MMSLRNHPVVYHFFCHLPTSCRKCSISPANLRNAGSIFCHVDRAYYVLLYSLYTNEQTPFPGNAELVHMIKSRILIVFIC